MVAIGSGAARQIEDWRLSRYACYLIVQTRRAELTDELAGLSEAERRLLLRDQVGEQNKDLAAVAYGAYGAGVLTGRDFAIFQDHGYMGLYNGEKAADIHARKGLKKSQGILDYMGSEELAANFFRITQTEANQARHEMGAPVRGFIRDQGGSMPEDLATPEVNAQELRRREQQRLASGPTLWDEASE
jgi:DNA-damage-inducible protein D